MNWRRITMRQVYLLLILGKKITPKDAIPLVPFLYIGMLLTLLIR